MSESIVRLSHYVAGEWLAVNIRDIKCGMVRVNGDTTGVDPHAPFGGMRASSSHSREQGPAAIEFFTETKTVQVNPAGGR